MKAIARKASGTLLVETRPGYGRIVSRDPREISDEMPIPAIVKFGYWQAITPIEIPLAIVKTLVHKGEGPGHEFHGNQYTGGIPGPQRESLTRISEQIREQRTERCVTVARDGTVVLDKDQGRTNRVHFEEAEIDAMRAAHGAIVVHNHPSGHAFSLDDALLAINVNAAEMRVVAMNQDPEQARAPIEYSLRPPAGGWPSFGVMEQAYAQVENEVYRTFKDAVIRGDMTVDEAEYRHHDRVWTWMADRDLVVYTRTP